MYYQTESMKKNYVKYHDMVFLNRKIYKTRFNRKFLMFQGVDGSACTCVFGVAVSKDEEVQDFVFALENFI